MHLHSQTALLYGVVYFGGSMNTEASIMNAIILRCHFVYILHMKAKALDRRVSLWYREFDAANARW